MFAFVVSIGIDIAIQPGRNSSVKHTTGIGEFSFLPPALLLLDTPHIAPPSFALFSFEAETLPTLSPEYGGLGKGKVLGQRNQRRDLSRRRKSEPIAGVRGNSRTRSGSISRRPARRESTRGVRQKNEEACRPSSQTAERGWTLTSNFLRSGGMTDLGNEQGQLKVSEIATAEGGTDP